MLQLLEESKFVSKVVFFQWPGIIGGGLVHTTELRAPVEETNALATAEGAAQKTGQNPRSLVDGCAGVVDVVAAREVQFLAARVPGLADGDILGRSHNDVALARGDDGSRGCAGKENKGVGAHLESEVAGWWEW